MRNRLHNGDTEGHWRLPKSMARGRVGTAFRGSCFTKKLKTVNRFGREAFGPYYPTRSLRGIQTAARSKVKAREGQRAATSSYRNSERKQGRRVRSPDLNRG